MMLSKTRGLLQFGLAEGAGVTNASLQGSSQTSDEESPAGVTDTPSRRCLRSSTDYRAEGITAQDGTSKEGRAHGPCFRPPGFSSLTATNASCIRDRIISTTKDRGHMADWTPYDPRPFFPSYGVCGWKMIRCRIERRGNSDTDLPLLPPSFRRPRIHLSW